MTSADNSVEKATPFYDDTVLGEIKSFEDAIARVSDDGYEPVSTLEYGSGFEVLKDKRQLVGQPFVIVQAAFWDSDFEVEGGQFVALHVVTKDGRKFIVNDGSTKSGIAHDAKVILQQRGSLVGVIAEKGLSVSEYDYVDDKGKHTPAATYYLK